VGQFTIGKMPDIRGSFYQEWIVPEESEE
jgi:hypothetical protein